MQIRMLDHVNLRTARLAEMVQWYEEVLGLVPGDRPNFGFPGAWLYAGPHAFIHLVGVEGQPGAGAEAPLKLEHFAFSAEGGADFEALLQARGERFRKAVVEDAGVVAFNIWDPDGNHIHVDFQLSE